MKNGYFFAALLQKILLQEENYWRRYTQDSYQANFYVEVIL